ncbi:MAG: calcium-binding protein, partial [Cyanobacteria bacterium J06642_11]
VIDKIEASPATTLATTIDFNVLGIPSALALGAPITLPYPAVTLPNPGRDTKPPILGTPGDNMLIGEELTEINGVTVTASDANGNSVVVTDDAMVTFGIADIIAGGLGNDKIIGGGGDDLLRGDRNERADGSAYAGGDDFIDGGTGDDLISGKSGNDELLGGDGNDRIWGDGGDDLINGGAGADILFGDSRRGGTDTFVLAVGEGGDVIEDYNFGGVIDIIQVLGATSFEAIQDGANTLIQADGELLATLTGYVGEVTFA